MSTPRTTPQRVPTADRGATRIADRVVAKIAAQAAREALAAQPAGLPAASGGARAVGLLGSAGPAGAGPAAPHATVTVHHDIARVRVSLELDYPCDLADRCAAVRRRVVSRIEECAGMSVPEVDIDIEHLHPAHAPGSAARDRKLR
ncbi:Asp23/Gls24 family envelope stress response protein [Streptomyces katrae]|uniref:Asp23/Gls24 family envelope stress response protein n=1 Tax=Streptomyces katrae TaxID=68223 RepID=UPI00055B29E9|nr:Asp23/Gls24 family envelope stress response protein [Streptomyces katrae]